MFVKQFSVLLLTVLPIAFFGYSGESVAGQWPKAASGRMTFPEKKWQEATPESQGVDSDKLDDAISYLKNNSGGDGVKELVIIRNGYMIWKGTNIDKVHGVWSLTKSFTSTVLGLLIDDGKAGLDTLARERIASMAVNYPDVTLRHFTTMTSGYYAVGDEPRGSYKHGPSLTAFKPGKTPLFRPPGSKYAYWDSAMNQFANILTVIGGEPIETLFKRKIADPIGMNRGKWDWGDFGKVDGIVVNGGSGNHNRHIRVSARELARFGHLYLNRGNWNGKQLISASWIDEATSVQVPASLTLGHPSSADGRGVYGYNWWTNGIKADGKRKWPGAPIGTYAASGYNNNDMFVIPEWNMVIVRLGLDGGRNGNISDAIYGTFLSKVGQTIGDVGIEGEAKRQAMSKQDRIKPYAENPRYWQYKRKPVLLVRRGAAAGVLAGDATFTRTRLTTVAETNMGHVPVADINGDGVIDIVAGLQWFEGPSWKRHPLYPPDPKPTAIDIGFTVPYDLDGDGDLDLTTHRRSSDDRKKNELFWFENPGVPSTGVWTKHHITWDTKWPEVIIFVDIDGDGRDEMICSDVCPDKGIRIYEIPQDPENASSWSWTTVDKSPLHGLGIGDLNEDGRLDIVSDFVWFEQDARGGWIRHSLPSPGSARRGHETMQIKVYDVDADGDVDLILPRAHHYGAFWLESSGGKKPSFKLHEILPGRLPSQLHGVAYGDIDGDGDLDIFAGKSRYRHGDPGNDEPLDVFWIELVRSSVPIRWVKHQLATDLTMGIGPTIADVDADGDMDLVLRGHGIGGRYVIGTRQTDVTLFIQNASVPAPAKLTAKSARSVTLRPPGSGPWVVLLADGGTRPDPYKDPECK